MGDDQRATMLNEFQKQTFIVRVEKLVRAYVDSGAELLIKGVHSRNETIVPQVDEPLRRIPAFGGAP